MESTAAAAPSADQNLPQIQETASINDVFRQLARQSTGTFILTGKGRPPTTIQGLALAEALLDLDPGARSGERKVGDVLLLFRQDLGAFPVRGDIHTRSNPPVFFCSNEPSHQNLEWNDGYCSVCPYPLASAGQRQA